MKDMKVLKVESSDIDLEVLDDGRKYRLDSPVTMLIHTNCGVIALYVHAGFVTDGRSGGFLVDWLIPNVGDKLYRRAWFAHDALFALASHCVRKGTIPAVSFETANELFRQIGSLARNRGGGGVAPWRMKLARRGVSGYFGRKAYDSTDKSDRKNDGLVSLTWDDK